MAIPIPVAERYIGQQPIIDAIIATLDATSQGASSCTVLYIEAGGGLGKTFLLRQLPELIGYEKAFIARMVDLSDTQNRNGSFLEATIREGLEAAPEQPYRLTAPQLQRRFDKYMTLRTQLERDRQRLLGGAFAQIRLELRAAFVEALNQIAQERPLILRFDTAESLTGEPPEPELRDWLAAIPQENGDLRFPSALDLFFEWFGDIIPRLRNVVVLICGRPVPAEISVETLFARCNALPNLETRRLEMQRLNEREVADYMQLAQPNCSPTLIAEAYALSQGAPLLLASYAWLNVVTENHAFTPQSRAEFERHLINRVLNPILPNAAFAVQVLAYCLYVLAYARRGITTAQLAQFLKDQSLPKPHEAFTDQERASYDELIGNLDKVALIKKRLPTGILYLHDEVQRMIDEFQIADRMGLRMEALSYLQALAVKEHEQKLRERAVTPRERADLLAAIIQRIYYDLELDPRTGYHQYLLAMLSLFENRSTELPLLLRDELWRWVNLRSRDPEKGEYQPRRRLLSSGANNPSLQELIADDLTWLLNYWLARNENLKVVAVGERALVDILPTHSADEYFHYVLKRTLAHALTLYHKLDVQNTAAEELYRDAIAIATRVSEERPTLQQQFFYDRIHFFLGRAQNLLGYLYRTLLEFDQARAQYEAALASYERYLQLGREEDRLYLPVNEDVTQVRINQVYVLARLGRFDEAQLLLAKLFVDVRKGWISTARQALINNVASILEIERNRPAEAEIFAKRARLMAAQVGNERVLAQVNAQLGVVSHDLMKHPPFPVDTAAEEYFRAAIDFFRTANEMTSLGETYLAYARYLRTLALNEKRKLSPDRVRIEALFQRAAGVLASADEAVGSLKLKRVILAAVEIVVERGFALRLQGQHAAAQQTLADAEQMLRANPLPRRALLVAATIAFERAWFAAEQNDARGMLRHLLTALCQCRIYAQNDRTILRFHEIIRENFEQFSAPLLQGAQAALDAADEDLPPHFPILTSALLSPLDTAQYQAAWPAFWLGELSFLQNEIDILLTKRE